METERVRRKFALKTRKWMEMGLGKRGGLDWIPKICPVKGSTEDSTLQQLIGETKSLSVIRAVGAAKTAAN